MIVPTMMMMNNNNNMNMNTNMNMNMNMNMMMPTSFNPYYYQENSQKNNEIKI